MTPRHPPRALGDLTTPTGRRTRRCNARIAVGRPPRIAAPRRLATRPAALSSNDHHSKGLTVVENDCHSLPSGLPAGLAAPPTRRGIASLLSRDTNRHIVREHPPASRRDLPLARIGHATTRRLAAGQGRGPSGLTAPARARRGCGSVDGPREGILEGSCRSRPRLGALPMSPVGPVPEGASPPAKGAASEGRPGHP